MAVLRLRVPQVARDTVVGPSTGETVVEVHTVVVVGVVSRRRVTRPVGPPLSSETTPDIPVRLRLVKSRQTLSPSVLERDTPHTENLLSLPVEESVVRLRTLV